MHCTTIKTFSQPLFQGAIRSHAEYKAIHLTAKHVITGLGAEFYYFVKRVICSRFQLLQ